MESNQAPSPLPQSRFNLWLITTIVLAVFLIAGGVVFAWQKTTGDKTKNDLQGQINTLQSQVQQLTKTYTNSKFSYTIEYPSSWYYKDYNDVTIDNVLLSRVVFSNKILPDDIGKIDPSQSISIWVENRPLAEARAAFLQDPFIGTVSETAITVDNIQATKLSGISKAAQYSSIEVMMSKDGKVYTVGGINSPSVSTALDRVLATFKFTK